MILACTKSIPSHRNAVITLDIDSDWFTNDSSLKIKDMSGLKSQDQRQDVVDTASSKCRGIDLPTTCSCRRPLNLSKSNAIEGGEFKRRLVRHRMESTDSPNGVIATIPHSESRNPASRRVIFPTLHRELDKPQQLIDNRLEICPYKHIQVSKDAHGLRRTFRTTASLDVSPLSSPCSPSTGKRYTDSVSDPNFLKPPLCIKENHRIELSSKSNQRNRAPVDSDKTSDSIHIKSTLQSKPPFHTKQGAATPPPPARSIFPHSPRLEYYKSSLFHQQMPLWDSSTELQISRQLEKDSSESSGNCVPISILRRSGRFSNVTNVQKQVIQWDISSFSTRTTDASSLCSTPDCKVKDSMTKDSSAKSGFTSEDSSINDNSTLESDVCHRIPASSECELNGNQGRVPSKRTYFDPRIWVREFERSNEEMERTWYSGEDMNRFKENALALIIRYHQQHCSQDSTTGSLALKKSAPVFQGRTALFSHQALRLDNAS